MASIIAKKLDEQGIILPEPAKPAASYEPFVIHGKQVFMSGQLPLLDGKVEYTGQVTSDVMIAEAQAAARLCGINLLAQLRVACGGDWSKFDRALKLNIFVNAPAGFTKAHLVANGVSDFLADILGDAGKHARAAVCVSELPLNAMVEVEGVFALK